MFFISNFIQNFKSTIIIVLLSVPVYAHPIHDEITMPQFSGKKPSFKCLISASPVQKISDGVWVSFELSSNQSSISKILPWHTPLEGIWKDLFLVKPQQQPPLQYAGPIMKRAAPVDADYTSFSSTKSLTNQVNLALTYPMEKKQSYHITLKPLTIHFITSNGQKETAQCVSNQLIVNIK